MSLVDVYKAVIAAEATESGAIELNGGMLLSLNMPAALTSTAMTIKTSPDGVTYQTFYKDGADKSYTVAAAKNVNVLDDRIMANYVKLVAGTAEEAERVFTVTAMRFD